MSEALTAFRNLSIPNNHAWQITELTMPSSDTAYIMLNIHEGLRTSIASFSTLRGDAIMSSSNGVIVARGDLTDQSYRRFTTTPSNTVVYNDNVSYIPDNGHTITLQYNDYIVI